MVVIKCSAVMGCIMASGPITAMEAVFTVCEGRCEVKCLRADEHSLRTREQEFSRTIRCEYKCARMRALFLAPSSQRTDRVFLL